MYVCVGGGGGGGEVSFDLACGSGSGPACNSDVGVFLLLPQFYLSFCHGSLGVQIPLSVCLLYVFMAEAFHVQVHTE